MHRAKYEVKKIFGHTDKTQSNITTTGARSPQLCPIHGEPIIMTKEQKRESKIEMQLDKIKARATYALLDKSKLKGSQNHGFGFPLGFLDSVKAEEEYDNQMKMRKSAQTTQKGLSSMDFINTKAGDSSDDEEMQ